VSTSWASVVFVLMFLFWTRCRKYKHAFDDKEDYMPSQLTAVLQFLHHEWRRCKRVITSICVLQVPGLFEQRDGLLSSQIEERNQAMVTSLRKELKAAQTSISALQEELQVLKASPTDKQELVPLL